MRPAHRVALAVVLACALGLVAHRVAAPRPLTSPAARPPASIPVQAPARPVEPAPPLLSSPDEGVDEGILLARRCLALAKHDPLAAMEFALKHNLTAVDPGLLSALILRWAEQDFSGALEWTRAQARDERRDDIFAHLAYLRAQTDPLAAARIVVADIPAGSARDEAVISVVHQWALRDAEAARLWVDGLSPETLRLRALAELTIINPKAH